MLVTRPELKKTIIKGSILIGVFSIFLNINPKTLFNFLIFLLIAFLMLIMYALWKKAYLYEISEDGIIIKSPYSKKLIKYNVIDDYFISSGLLARKFNVGSIYIILKSGKVEIIRDVKFPENVEAEIRKYLPT
ncbi:PH domain-containing protein [Acidianus ambivalens]|uniref:PH domain-containing protein n=1 Tax=Acidianus ambivalens TaxID=2283 RepID=A0A650CWL2_ACIAM|nr:PH domain-containing protein [Acidianus ambivalens]MQL54359.1 PH domain-containing protein [Acidianus ambivalens]QGR22183.1 PH domain-containing protein [Acidianus ambivalens]